MKYIVETVLGDVPAGTVTCFAGAEAPVGYLLCQGQEVSRTNFEKLFSIIGITYGSGDGSTTFNIPNLCQRFPRGANPGELGTVGGSDTANVNMADHYHAVGYLSTDNNGYFLATDASTTIKPNLPDNVAPYDWNGSGSDYYIKPRTGEDILTSYPVGGSTGTSSIATVPAYIAMNYIIKY